MKSRRDYDFYVYILSNHERTCFYVGLTNDIIRRIIEHQNEFGSNFASKYRLKEILYFENYQYIHDAINREKELKKWRREKKLNLIKTVNSDLKELNNELFDDYGITKEDIDNHSRYLRDRYNK